MEKIWLKNYEAGISADIDTILDRNLGEYFDNACRTYADQIAFSNFGADIKYARLKDQSDYFMAYLSQHLALKKNDRVAIMLPNLIQYPIILLACLKSGLAVVNINPLYTVEELKFQLKDSGAETLIVLKNFAHTVEKVSKIYPIKNIIITDVGDEFSFSQRIFTEFLLKYLKKSMPKYRLKQAVSFRKALRLGKQIWSRSAKQAYVTVHLTDIAFLQYTGGTTGTSKAAVLSHENILANIKQSALWIHRVTSPGKDIVITALPLYHIFSLTVNCLLFLGIGARNILITDPKDIERFILTLQQYPFTTITGVNTLFALLLSHPKFKQLDFSALKLTLSGGMSVQKSIAKRWEAITQKPLIEAYGLTETSPGAIIHPMNSQGYDGTVGLPLPSTDVRLCDASGQTVACRIPGELYIKGPQVMVGYWNRPDETQACLKDGWLKTGDIACMEPSGYIRIVDRKKEMILVSGFNVYPNQIEKVLENCDKIKEAGVIGETLPDQREQVVAYVVKSDPDLTEAAVIEHARQFLAAYKIPKKILFIESLPKTNVGKISRKDLKKLLATFKQDP